MSVEGDCCDRTHPHARAVGAKLVSCKRKALVSPSRGNGWETSYGDSDLFEGDFSEIFSVLPFIFGLPIPNLSNASLTSPGAPGTRFFGFVVETALLTPPLRTLKGLWAGPRFTEVGGSKVFTDAGRGATRAGFDMLLRPSSAPRRSATPTPRLNFPRLWRERLSMFIKVGVTRSRE